ncbi:Aldehyde/histidinol dehydrogenase [Xylaria digitata]|nr:Aldehyde/histidinol dehydrogenase [Xylaria digitata]
MASSKYSRIRSAVIDGRLQNPFYRKAQLKHIHDALFENGAAIRQAMLEDTRYRSVEVELEYWLALECLAKHFDAIDPESSLNREYAITRGEDLIEGTEPIGVVVIEPATHCFLYCLVSALAPALSAGNAIIIQADQSILKTPPIVLASVGDALDKDIFQIVQQEVDSINLGCRHIRVLQNGSKISDSSTGLLSNTEARVLAVVECDVDIAAAADALAAACFGLRGRSPYAPDLVLVNEQVKKEFLIAVSRRAVELVADYTEPRGKLARNEGKSDMIRRVYEEGFATIVSTNPSALILDIHDRTSFLLRDKLQEPCLPVLATTSMEDAIDTSRSYGRSAAIYVFASPPAAKYLCQFMDASVSFVGQVPPALLFSPRAPESKSPLASRECPYHEGQFTISKQQFITCSTLTKTLGSILLNSTTSQAKSVLRAAPLPPVKRLINKRGVGFFEQGIITGLTLVLSVTVSLAGALGYYIYNIGKYRFSH